MDKYRQMVRPTDKQTDRQMERLSNVQMNRQIYLWIDRQSDRLKDSQTDEQIDSWPYNCSTYEQTNGQITRQVHNLAVICTIGLTYEWTDRLTGGQTKRHKSRFDIAFEWYIWCIGRLSSDVGTNRQTDRQMERSSDIGQMNRWSYLWTVRQSDGQTDGEIVRQMGKLKVRQTNLPMNRQTDILTWQMDNLTAICTIVSTVEWAVW
jgi:hypothetical protein